MTKNEQKVCCLHCEHSVLKADEAGNICRICWNRDSDKWMKTVKDKEMCLDWEPKQSI